MSPTGEFYEVKCHEGPISRLHVSYDDCLLVSAGEDGSVVLMDIRDKELAKVSTRQQQARIWVVLGACSRQCVALSCNLASTPCANCSCIRPTMYPRGQMHDAGMSEMRGMLGNAVGCRRI